MTKIYPLPGYLKRFVTAEFCFYFTKKGLAGPLDIFECPNRNFVYLEKKFKNILQKGVFCIYSPPLCLNKK